MATSTVLLVVAGLALLLVLWKVVKVAVVVAIIGAGVMFFPDVLAFAKSFLG